MLADEEERSRRIEMVHAWQRHYHMEPRDDSQLTRLFAEGQLAMTADEVARELVCTDFLYKHTLYGDLLEDFMRAVAGRLREETKLSWTATWQIVRFYAPTALKLMCLSSSGDFLPEHLPDARCSP